MELELVPLENAPGQEKLRIRPGQEILVGRAQECDLRLGHRGVSRRHCRLTHDGGALRVTDLGSANGTLVDGQRVETGRLEPGGELAVGAVTFRCRAVSARRAAPDGEGEDVRRTRVSYREGGSTTVLRKKVETRMPIEGEEPGAGESLEELRRAQRNLGAAYQVSKLLNRAPDMEGLFDGVISSVFEAVNADRVAVLMQDGETSEESTDGLRVVAARKREAGEGETPDEISVSRTVIRDVLSNGVSTLSRDAGTDSRFQDAQSIVAQHIQSVVCAPLATDEEILGVLYADSRSVARAFNENDLELLALIGNQAGVAIQRAELMQELEQFFFDSIRAIVATIDAKDGYTHRHSERVAAFAMRIAREAGADEDELEVVRLSGLLHDIGKIGVPDAILNKPGDLTDEEFEEVKKHPVHGERILGHIHNERFEPILPGVRHHHEKWDGTGYPDGLAEEEIPYLGRLLAVADVLDALSSDRSYREAYSLDRTVEIIHDDAGTHFDPELARAAVALHERDGLQVPRDAAGAGPDPVLSGFPFDGGPRDPTDRLDRDGAGPSQASPETSR